MTDEATRYGCWHCGTAGPREAFIIEKALHVGHVYFCVDAQACSAHADEYLPEDEATELLAKLERGEC